MAKPAETEAADLAGYSVSDERLVDRRKLAALLGPHGLSFDRLQPYSVSAAFWAESVAIAHRHFGFGLNQRVGIIDSGFAVQCAKALNIDIYRSADFTGKGIEDMLGHGTCVGALLNAVAPQAIQIHAKVLHTSAASVAEIAERLEKAVTHLEAEKIDIVNVSFNHLTGFHEHDPVDFRPGWYCHCPICAILSGYVKRTGASVFVSEGNFKHGKRSEGSWSCPAAAHYVTPVFGYGPDGKFYDVNMPDIYGVLAPAQIGLIPHRLTIVDRLRTLFGRPRAEVIVGSSYAAPLAAGTHACVRSLLLELGYHRRCVPPRNQEEGDTSADAQFDFPLDNLFFSPAERLDDTLAFDRQAEWFGAFNNAIVSANMQLAEGKPENAGLLCCIFAWWMKHAICENPEQQRSVTAAAFAMNLFLNGIRTLFQTELAITCDRYIDQAEQLCRNLRSKGVVLAGETELADLKSAYKANCSLLLFRVGEDAELEN